VVPAEEGVRVSASILVENVALSVFAIGGPALRSDIGRLIAAELGVPSYALLLGATDVTPSGNGLTAIRFNALLEQKMVPSLVTKLVSKHFRARITTELAEVLNTPLARVAEARLHGVYAAAESSGAETRTVTIIRTAAVFPSLDFATLKSNLTLKAMAERSIEQFYGLPSGSVVNDTVTVRANSVEVTSQITVAASLSAHLTASNMKVIIEGVVATTVRNITLDAPTVDTTGPLPVYSYTGSAAVTRQAPARHSQALVQIDEALWNPSYDQKMHTELCELLNVPPKYLSFAATSAVSDGDVIRITFEVRITQVEAATMLDKTRNTNIADFASHLGSVFDMDVQVTGWTVLGVTSITVPRTPSLAPLSLKLMLPWTPSFLRVKGTAALKAISTALEVETDFLEIDQCSPVNDGIQLQVLADLGPSSISMSQFEAKVSKAISKGSLLWQLSQNGIYAQAVALVGSGDFGVSGSTITAGMEVLLDQHVDALALPSQLASSVARLLKIEKSDVEIQLTTVLTSMLLAGLPNRVYRLDIRTPANQAEMTRELTTMLSDGSLLAGVSAQESHVMAVRALDLTPQGAAPAETSYCPTSSSLTHGDACACDFGYSGELTYDPFKGRYVGLCTRVATMQLPSSTSCPAHASTNGVSCLCSTGYRASLVWNPVSDHLDTLCKTHEVALTQAPILSALQPAGVLQNIRVMASQSVRVRSRESVNIDVEE